jgi:alkane 1-monooxygenase
MLTGLVYMLCGLRSLEFFLLQNVIAIVMLHGADYLQHYGLVRRVTANGGYEKLTARHAWNTGRFNPAFNLFQLEQHADHHMHPARPYDQLSHTSESPSHPAGYSFMLLLALAPPLWFRVMDKRIPSPNVLNATL